MTGILPWVVAMPRGESEDLCTSNVVKCGKP
jgi:hypothetical protein